MNIILQQCQMNMLPMNIEKGWGWRGEEKRVNLVTLGGLIPTLMKSSGFMSGSSIDSLNSLI